MKTHDALGRPIRRRPADERFWAKVAVGAPDECWPWTGYRDRKGYGNFHPMHGTSIPAHRFALQLQTGPLPADRLACHRCDNPPCCNPAHLFVGTAADNSRDMVAKGRGRGKPPRLTDADVIEIRALAAAGLRHSAIARRVGTVQSHVHGIVHGIARSNVR